mmetsp:Transcript_60083/g.143157  ORF Transcript_60083/g.143157 Transcript_60083/m.143157 type:complete len:405 (+) Transcript_60083:107-1321(+)|eukprot:CAMPEP_0178420190 /NCGR_PEP_ID=MMETSP0689_2-20121128/26001_1 /TAXON_ID=160604 /ORGANISM="Amphidinium massartii, Strain CS-259" /LENGTH=404 /DNA_ID=CAMNT_0020041657 /DNA_START=35 /DNA_END=1246 /DNA_ORIENTATION=-
MASVTADFYTRMRVVLRNILSTAQVADQIAVMEMANRDGLEDLIAVSPHLQQELERSLAAYLHLKKVAQRHDALTSQWADTAVLDSGLTGLPPGRSPGVSQPPATFPPRDAGTQPRAPWMGQSALPAVGLCEEEGKTAWAAQHPLHPNGNVNVTGALEGPPGGIFLDSWNTPHPRAKPAENGFEDVLTRTHARWLNDRYPQMPFHGGTSDRMVSPGLPMQSVWSRGEVASLYDQEAHGTPEPNSHTAQHTRPVATGPAMVVKPDEVKSQNIGAGNQPGAAAAALKKILSAADRDASTISGVQYQHSAGSDQHHLDTCKPCLFFIAGQCNREASCRYCHLEHSVARLQGIHTSKKTQKSLVRRQKEVAMQTHEPGVRDGGVGQEIPPMAPLSSVGEHRAIGLVVL